MDRWDRRRAMTDHGDPYRYDVRKERQEKRDSEGALVEVTLVAVVN